MGIKALVTSPTLWIWQTERECGYIFNGRDGRDGLDSSLRWNDWMENIKETR
jgi:hypothetical protein